MAICKTCKGSGVDPIGDFMRQNGEQFGLTKLCRACKGLGRDRDNRCKNCVWELAESGCNTEWDSDTCRLNRKDKKEHDRVEAKKKIETLLLDVAEIKESATSDGSYADKIKELMKARRRLIQLGKKKI